MTVNQGADELGLVSCSVGSLPLAACQIKRSVDKIASKPQTLTGIPPELAALAPYPGSVIHCGKCGSTRPAPPIVETCSRCLDAEGNKARCLSCETWHPVADLANGVCVHCIDFEIEQEEAKR
mgnify:CR=1 FL=1